jgi:hypothetical protein
VARPFHELHDADMHVRYEEMAAAPGRLRPLPTTHAFLAMVLGVRRAGITLAASRLRTSGLIHDERGCIEATGRSGPESATCGCYGVARQALGRLLGSSAGATGFSCHWWAAAPFVETAS